MYFHLVSWLATHEWPHSTWSSPGGNLIFPVCLYHVLYCLHHLSGGRLFSGEVNIATLAIITPGIGGWHARLHTNISNSVACSYLILFIATCLTNELIRCMWFLTCIPVLAIKTFNQHKGFRGQRQGRYSHSFSWGVVDMLVAVNKYLPPVIICLWFAATVRWRRLLVKEMSHIQSWPLWLMASLHKRVLSGILWKAQMTPVWQAKLHRLPDSHFPTCLIQKGLLYMYISWGRDCAPL